MIAQPEELNTEKKSLAALKFHELRTLRKEEMNHLDHMHDVYEMLVKVKKEALNLDIPLDEKTCMRQLQAFSTDESKNFEISDDAEIREGFKLVYNQFSDFLRQN